MLDTRLHESQIVFLLHINDPNYPGQDEIINIWGSLGKFYLFFQQVEQVLNLRFQAIDDWCNGSGPNFDMICNLHIRLSNFEWDFKWIEISNIITNWFLNVECLILWPKKNRPTIWVWCAPDHGLQGGIAI